MRITGAELFNLPCFKEIGWDSYENFTMGERSVILALVKYLGVIGVGVFDEFGFSCPNCKAKHIIQSKAAAAPSLLRYYTKNVPASIAGELETLRFVCTNCTKVVRWKVDVKVTPYIDYSNVDTDEDEEW